MNLLRRTLVVLRGGRSRSNTKTMAKDHRQGGSQKTAEVRDGLALRPGPIQTRTAIAVIAVLVACGSYVLGASITPSARGDINGETGVSLGIGLDSCEFPSVGALRYLWKNSGWRPAYLGDYIGGRTPCREEFTKGEVNRLHAIGYDFLPIMDGRQPPCSMETTDPTKHFSDDPTEEYRQAREEAAVEANLAVKRLKELGMTPPGSIVYYDFESFNYENAQCLAAAKAFINNWDHRLQEAYEVKAGLYGPAEGADVDAFWNLNNRPDDLWYSETWAQSVPANLGINYKHRSVWAVPTTRIPDSHGSARRLHQWVRNVNAWHINSEGKKIPYEVDINCAMGLVAGSGGKRPEEKCQEKYS
jgi:hypothetical protein